MLDTIRGIECTLFNEKIEELLIFLSHELGEFYIPWCLKIDDSQMLLPTSIESCHISANNLIELAKSSIWELVLHIYPISSKYEMIETYDDFIKSACRCCLIFYDCGLMDIYIKGKKLFERIHNKLIALEAGDMRLITDVSDTRTILHL